MRMRMHQKQNISKQYRILTCGNPLGDFYTASKALVQDLASVNAQVLDTVERANGSQTECCIWESGWSYRGKWLLSLPGDNPIFCKNEGWSNGRVMCSSHSVMWRKHMTHLVPLVVMLSLIFWSMSCLLD